MVERWCEVGGRPQEERDRDGGESARRGVVERVCEASDGCEFAAREQPGQRGRPFGGHDAITLPADDERGYVDLRHSGFDGVTQPGDEGLDRCTDSAMQVALKRLEAVVISNRMSSRFLPGICTVRCRRRLRIGHSSSRPVSRRLPYCRGKSRRHRCIRPSRPASPFTWSPSTRL